MIRFNFMCSHTNDGVASGNYTRRDIMAHLKSSLPIQDDSRFVTFRAGKANVEECFRSEIGA
jgi:hypothetical protein